MPLQVRVVHALAEQLLDLPDHDGTSPLVVGRSEAADLHIPTTGISRRHCLLYQRDGQWILEDARSTAGTFVNGRRVTAPITLASGDQISLGHDPSPPVLTVDPFGLLKVKSVAQPAVPAAPARRRIADPVGSMAPAPRAAAAYPVPAAMAPAEQLSPEEQEWRRAQRAPSRNAPPRKSGSGGVIGATLATATVLAAGVFGLYKFRVRQIAAGEAADRAAHSSKPATTQKPTSRHVFSKDLFVVKNFAGEDVARAKRLEERRDDPGWLSVEYAHVGRRDPRLAISTCLEYLHESPNSPYIADVQQYIAEDLDRAWWDHITDLFAERARLNERLAPPTTSPAATAPATNARSAATQAIPELPMSDQDRSDIADRIRVIEQELADLKYTGKEPPVADTEAKRSDLRETRDPIFYAEWKKRAVERIRASHGQDSLW